MTTKHHTIRVGMALHIEDRDGKAVLSTEHLGEIGSCDRQTFLDTIAREFGVAIVRADPDEQHVIEFRTDGWTIQHPVAERLAGTLFDCPVNRVAEVELTEPPSTLGRFYVELNETGDGLIIVGPATEHTDAMLAAATPRRPTGVLAEIAAERTSQDAKWGQQNHPDADPVIVSRLGSGMPYGDPTSVALRLAMEYEIPTASRAKRICQTEAARDGATWIGIAVEELAEALEATTAEPAALRTELVQLAAVAVAWIEALDRRQAQAVDHG